MLQNILNQKPTVLFFSTLALLFGFVPEAAHAGEGTLISWACGKKATQAIKEEKTKANQSLAFIPTYTGKGSLNRGGNHSTGLPSGECYEVNYLMREATDTVHSWYGEALQQNGWTIDPKQGSTCSISARRGNGMSCYVYTRPSKKAGFACETILRLSIRPY